MSVKLREKQMKNGQISFYLDIYHNKTRWYEFLDIHINKSRPNDEDKEKRRLANEIRSKKEHQLITDVNDLETQPTQIKCFIKYYELHQQSSNHRSHLTVLNHLKAFTKGAILPFGKISTQWLKDFEYYLLNKGVKNNSTMNYMINLNGILNAAVRDKLLKRNPYHDVPTAKRMKKQDIYRLSYSIEQLQHLANTPCKIEKQIKQAYLLSCFTGLRWSDVNVLRWDEILIRKVEGQSLYFFHFEQEKTENIEYLPISQSAVSIIEERMEEAKKELHSPYVFFKLADPNKKYYTYKRMKRGLKKWSEQAGLERIKFHSGRHSFATNMLENCEEGDLYTVSKLLGHKSIQSTQVYAKVRDKKKIAAVQSMPQIDFSRIALRK
jgi:integrase